MKKSHLIVAFCLLATVALTTQAQEKEEYVDLSEKEFTIENCVSSFEMENTIKTKVGYQFWFVDKEFIGEEECRSIMSEKYGERDDKFNDEGNLRTEKLDGDFFSRIFSWLRNLFE